MKKFNRGPKPPSGAREERTRLGCRVLRGEVRHVGEVDLGDAVGRRRRLADPRFAVGLAAEPPSTVAEPRPGTLVIRELVRRPSVAGGAELDQVTGRPVVRDLRLADEAEARLRDQVGHLVDVALEVVVPPQHGLVDVAGHGQRHLAVALADGRRLEFCNTLLEIGAAISRRDRRRSRWSRRGWRWRRPRGPSFASVPSCLSPVSDGSVGAGSSTRGPAMARVRPRRTHAREAHAARTERVTQATLRD